MPDVFAGRFDVVPEHDIPPVDVVPMAIRAWIADRVPNPADFTLTKGWALRTADGSILRWEPYSHGETRLLEFTWKHPHMADPAIWWSTTVSYVERGAKKRLSIKVFNTGPQVGAPGCLLTTRPRLLILLSEMLGLRSSGVRCLPSAEVLREEHIPSFVRYVLLDNQRQAPIVLVTGDYNDRLPVPADDLAKEFLGLSRVYAIPRARDTYRLTEELKGKRLSCFGGAMRVYMPGLGFDSDTFAHPLILSHRLGQPDSRRLLANRLALLTTARFESDPDLWALRDERSVAMASEREALRVDLETKRAQVAGQADWEQMFHLSDQDLADVTVERDDLRQQLAVAEQRSEVLASRVRQLTAALRSRDASEIGRVVEEEDVAFQPETVLDAVQQAAELCDEFLWLLPSAFDSASASPYARPAEVLKALSCLAFVAEGMRSGPLGKGLREAFAELGQDYAGGLSKTTPRHLRRQYEFPNAGETYVCEEHLRMGNSRDPSNCLRIYFNSEVRPGNRIVVGHVGEHLETMQTD